MKKIKGIAKSTEGNPNLVPKVSRKAISKGRFIRSRFEYYSVPAISFRRLVREEGGSYRWTREAMTTIQTIYEKFGQDVFYGAMMCASHAKRKTVRPADFELLFSLSILFKSSMLDFYSLRV
jgi:histone H3/H4